MTWCFQDEASPTTDALLDRLKHDRAVAPALWRWEVSNVLAMAVRRNRITLAEATTKLRHLDALPIQIDDEAQGQAWRSTLQLADAHALTVYDAAYLELALRLGLELATRDADLMRAAASLGVAVIP